ncbi:MAG: exodeoxyribonuclease V subunit gamma [Clostridia bacterium]|nr:exodeoxyribonuclease V subunit gamma [Clostridia bacterium]
MLNRIIGRARSGKTSVLLSFLEEKLNEGFECVLLVPEQQSVQAERRLCELLGDGYNIGCEVLNFERLPNRIYREYGGLAAEVLDDGASEAVMSLCVEKLKEKLKLYGNCRLSGDFIKKLTSSVTDLDRAGVSSSMLAFFADRFGGTPVGDKLSDIALISGEYRAFMSGELTNRYSALEKLSSELKDKPFFSGKAVFIDGYFDFSDIEYRILKDIIDQSADTYITVFNDENDDTGLFELTYNAAEKLKKLVGGRANDIILRPDDTDVTPTLAYLERNFYRTGADKKNNDGSFSVVECQTVFEEAEAAASKVVSLIKRGMRYRDINIIMRNTSDYEGIIDLVFKKYGIPFYFADKDSAAEKSICSLISAVFEIASGDFSAKAVKKYLNSGFSALSVVECDALIAYIETWRIRGKKRYSDEEWAMNPDGFKKELSGRDAFTLNRVNNAKKKLASSLIPLCETLGQKDVTVRSALTAVFEHLKEIRADAKLKKRAAEAEENGDEDERNKLSMLWESITKSFETLCGLCGDSQMTPERIGGLLSLILSSKKLGSIPVSLDCVNIGGASLIRPDNCRAMIVLGANDGVFPAPPSENMLFSASEARELLNSGLDLNISPENENKKENFTFYYVCSAPTDDLTLMYHSGDVSGAECRLSSTALFLTSLFDMKIHKYSFGDRIFCKKALLDNISSLQENELEAASAHYGADGEFQNALRQSKEKLSEANARIDYADGRRLRLSSSRLETYRKCPFSYFAKYLLDLREPKEADFSSLETGNFFHTILEMFMKKRTETGTFVAADDETIKKEADAYIEEYIVMTAGNGANITPRMRYVINKLKKSVFLLLKNITEEFSLCAFTPCGIEEEISAEYTGEDGTAVSLKGKIDRIDILKKGGKTYVRVTDYKTGNKKFDADAIQNGLDMQMLIYLFAYIDRESKLKKGVEILPAGVLYMPVFLQSAEGEFSEDDIRQRFRRTGLVIDDKEIVDDMERGAAGLFIPVKTKQDGSFTAFSSLASLETFGKLKEDIAGPIITLAKEIAGGKMDAKPFRFKKKSPCSYCEMKPFCRAARHS